MEKKRVKFDIETAVCGQCRKQDEAKRQEASAFCKTCKEFLCIHCLKPHRRLVAMENHQLLNRDHVIANYKEDDLTLNGIERDLFEEMRSKLSEEIKKLSSNTVQGYEEYRHRTVTMLEINNKLPEEIEETEDKHAEKDEFLFTESCSIHQDKTIQFYCEVHRELCCSVCKNEQHRTCLSKVKFIPDKINDSPKEDDPFLKIKNEVAEFKEYEKSIQNDLRQLKKSRETFLYDLKSTKREVINWVNLMEVRAVRRLEIVYDKCKRDLELKRRKSKEACEELRTEMYFLKEILASDKNDDVYKFIKTKKADNVVVTSVQKRAHRQFTNTRFALKLNSDFDNLKNDINHLYELQFEMKGEDKFNIRIKDDTHGSNITGCAYLSNGDIALADRGNAKIKIFNIQMFKQLAQLTVDCGVFDVTAVSANTLAVTSPLKSKIHLVERRKELKIAKAINTGSGTCWGVRHQNGLFIVNVSTKDTSYIRVVDIDSQIIFQAETKCSFFSSLFSETDSEILKIIVAAAFVDGYKTEMVHCIEEHTKSETHDIVILEYNYLNHLHTKGVSLDSYGNPVVCCPDTDQIYTISRTGEEAELLLAESDGLCKPQSLCFNEDNTKLLVTSENTDFIQIFKFEQ